MRKELLVFRWSGTFKEARLLMATLNKVNMHAWMHRAAKTCKVENVHIEGCGDPMSGMIVVRHRAAGFGVRRVDRGLQGYLDGRGKPLPEGQEKVVLEFDVFGSIDFNGFDFGELVSGREMGE